MTLHSGHGLYLFAISCLRVKRLAGYLSARCTGIRLGGGVLRDTRRGHRRGGVVTSVVESGVLLR